MTEKTWESIRGALFEATFVVLGVILAFAVDNWREQRENRLKAIAARGSVIEEIRTNRSVLAESVAYHSGVLGVLRAEHPEGWEPDMRLFNRGFINPARLHRVAWESAASTGALANMEYPTVLELSKPYAMQHRYDKQTEITSQIIYEELYRTGAPGMARNYRNIQRIIAASLYQEQQLMATFDQTLSKLK